MFRRSSSATVRNFSYARPLFNSTQQQHHHHRLKQHLLPLNNRNVGTGPAGILARERAASPQSPHSSYFSTTSVSRSPALVPPDHLDPKELHIFNKLVTELSPSRLEVRRISDIGPSCSHKAYRTMPFHTTFTTLCNCNCIDTDSLIPHTNFTITPLPLIPFSPT